MATDTQLKKQRLAGRSAIVCGGSLGIGKETAREIVRLGGSVCIVARRADPLAATAVELSALVQGDAQFVETIACDATDMARLEPLLADYVVRRRTPNLLINVVGFAYPQYVQKLTLDDFRTSMEVNYFGQLIPTLIMLPYFLEAGKGQLAFVSSMMGYFGIMGYAAYAPSKFAIVGLAETLRHELKPHNIGVSVLYPPDTETPGFEIENQTKPEECAQISESGKLLNAQEVAEVFVAGILKRQFAIHPRESGLVWRVNRFSPAALRWFTDRKYRQVRQSTGAISRL